MDESGSSRALLKQPFFLPYPPGRNLLYNRKKCDPGASRARHEVTVEGTLTVKKISAKKCDWALPIAFGGTVESETDDGKSDKLAGASAVDNPHSRLSWNSRWSRRGRNNQIPLQAMAARL